MRQPVRQHFLHPRRGAICVLVALALIGMIGILALCLENGSMYDKRRQVQAGAEAAALAGARELLSQYDVGHGRDANGKAVASAAAIAKGNGWGTNSSSTVKINIPPLTGTEAGHNGYIEVIITYNHTRTFSRVLGTQPITIQARAVCSGTFVPTKASILVLEPKKKGALKLDKAHLKVRGDLIVNSTDKNAVQLKKDTTIDADTFMLSGGIEKKGQKYVTGEVFGNLPPTPDPLSSLAAPAKTAKLDPNHFKTTESGRDVYRLVPGTYEKLDFDKNDLVIMAPGVYYLDKDGLRMKGTSSLFAEEVLLYNAGNKDLKFETHGNVRLTPPVSGIYRGISIFQSRTSKKSIKFKNDGDIDINGTIYAPSGEVRFQKVDLTIGGFSDDDKSFEDWDDGAAEILEAEDAAPSYDSQASANISIISKRFKIDKKSNVTLTGTGIEATKPRVGVVE